MSARREMTLSMAFAILVAWVLWVSCFVALFLVDERYVLRVGFALLAVSVLVVTA